MNSSELCARAGITYRQLDYWIEKGYMAVTPGTGQGSGYPREFAPAQVAHAQRMAALIYAGFTVTAADTYARTTGTHDIHAPGYHIQIHKA